MSPRPNVSEERKQQILDAAIAVFARLGFRAARMDDVAEQAGLSKGALYLYYKSKDAIIVALLQHLFAQEFKQLQALVESEGKRIGIATSSASQRWKCALAGCITDPSRKEFLSPEETAQLILALIRQHPREVRFAGPVLGIDPDAPEPVLHARIEAFFRGVRFRPAA